MIEDDNGYYQRKKRLAALRKRECFNLDKKRDKNKAIALRKQAAKPRKKVNGEAYAKNLLKWLDKVEE